MNVLHLLVKGEAGGIESLCRDYANYSNNKNVFAFLKGVDSVNAVKMKKSGHTVIELNYSSQKAIGVWKNLNKQIKLYSIDEIVVHHASPILYLFAWGLKLKNSYLKIVAYAHCEAEDMLSGSGKLSIKDKIIVHSFANSDKVIAISSAVRSSLIECFGLQENCDVFVTGSNAKFLSRDIATEFGGRGDEVHMYPLSFSEFMSCYGGNKYDGWNEYITYGGIPLVVLAETDEQKMILLDNLFQETYISDIVKRNKIRNVGEMESLLDVLASAIGALTNPNKLQKTFKSVNNSKITATTITKYIEYLEDAFLIEEANRYDIKGKSYIGTPLKYYFMDMGLRNSRIHYRQMEATHSMENVIYNELRMRGFHVDVGNLTVVEKGKDAKPVKKQLEVDFICNKGSKKYYIQSAYMLETEAKMAQEIRPFLKINDSFKKIVITSNTPKPFYNDQGILIMNVYDFLLNVESLKL